ncbi:YggT family protein [Polynucleobacter sphagniphilus]|uniref:YggT family protein n=1 Tax=Polynucleobacter sphagniphilus TaxID=1743169 RepID=UPI0024762550|nr:YggT family protein [Polynucleobacter sphagniphilus]MDH6422128.1 YggT family protein [Polynucleobacter sphagniphilus]
MIFQILNFLLQITVSIVAGACILRCYLQWLGFNLGIGQGKSLATYLLPITNWLVLPLRKVTPSVGRLDSASLLAAYIVVLLKAIAVATLISIPLEVLPLLIFSLLDLLQMTLSGLIGLVFASVLLSWVGPGSQMQIILGILVEPVLAPIRRCLPNSGAWDLSPVVLLVLLQVLQIVLNNLK